MPEANNAVTRNTDTSNTDTRPPMFCIACSRQQEEAYALQPYNATSFWTSGHYGSTCFDVQDGSRQLQIVVCDPCLMRHSARVFHLQNDEVTVWEPAESTWAWVAKCAASLADRAAAAQ